jgi:type I restriction enzyme M protein
MLDGQNATITAIEIVPSTELTILPTGQTNVDSSILPNGVLYRKGSEAKIRKSLLNQDLLETVIGLGPNIFYGTQLSPCMLIFKKKKEKSKKKKVFFIDASNQIRIGRAQNYLELNHIKKIYEQYCAYEDFENYTKLVTINDIKENDYNLHIPLYVERIVKNNSTTLDDILHDTETVMREVTASEIKFKHLLKDFYNETD